MSRWTDEEHGVPHGETYDERWRRMKEKGEWVHGEADLVSWFEPRSVLDAGCGTGRVAIELSRRGVRAVGVDLDTRMLEVARSKSSDVRWILGDLCDVAVTADALDAEPGDDAGPGGTRASGDATDRVQTFDLVVMAGNVMVFVAAGTEAAVVANAARHLKPGGRLVAGFELGRTPLTLEEYDAAAADAGLVLEHRWSTWDRESYEGGDYAVSAHRAPA